MSGCSRWKYGSRGSSHSDANDAKVVTLTWRRLRTLRIWRTRGVELLQQRRHRAQQRRAGAGELDMARAAQEQRRAEFVLERADLAADGRLGEVQFLGGGAKAQAPRHRLEGPQAAQRERPVARRIHIEFASMTSQKHDWIL